jgi:DNA-binding transcriptional ArsR family regulator
VSTYTVRNGDALAALAHPSRVRILELLREPASASETARRLGEPRQRVNYHLKELERAGLVERVGERRVRNLIEVLYQAVARTFVVSPEVAWADPRRMQAMREQHSLETLVQLGERLERDAVALLDRAAFDGETIASASAVAEVRFATEADRAAFLRDYLAEVGPLLDRHGARCGAPYRVLIAAYPDPESETPSSTTSKKEQS